MRRWVGAMAVATVVTGSFVGVASSEASVASVGYIVRQWLRHAEWTRVMVRGVPRHGAPEPVQLRDGIGPTCAEPVGMKPP